MRFYAYQHIRLDKNEIFYIGIGTRSKQDIQCNTYSRAYSKHIDNNIWMKIVSKTNWRFEILLESNTREEVENEEKRLILLYGRIFNDTGILANFTLGGELNLGFKHSKESKNKISNSHKGKPGRRLGTKLTSEQLIKASITQIKVANRPEMIELRRNIAKGNTYHLGKKHSEESKKQMSESAKRRGTNAITIKCSLLDKINNLKWEANSIVDLSKAVPISLSTLNRLSQGIKVSEKINNQYKFEK